MTPRLLWLPIILMSTRARAEPAAQPCSCEVSDLGKDRKRMAIVFAGIGAGLVGASFAYAVYQRHEYNDAIARLDAAEDTSSALSATDDANDARRMLRYVGTGVFLAGSAALGAATYLYLTAPDQEVVLKPQAKTHMTPAVSRGFAGIALTRSF